MSNIGQKTYDTCPPHKVAFLGLGVMGYPMAGHLTRAGHQVTVYNRSPAKAQAWMAECPGHASAPTPREAAAGADIVFACVGNDDDLRSVVLGPDGAFAGMKPGAVLINLGRGEQVVEDDLVAALDQGRAFLRAGFRHEFRVGVAFGLHGLDALLQIQQFTVHAQQIVDVDVHALDLRGVLDSPGVLTDELEV